jgi:outer membrane protein assembly factor BamB
MGKILVLKLFLLFVFVGISFTYFGVINKSQAQLADSPWPAFHANTKHTGVSKYRTNINKPYLKWKFDAQNAIETSPVIASDGTIYFGSVKDNFFALNSDGTIKWKFTRIGEEFRSTPAIASDGTIYFAALYNIRPVYNIHHKRDMEYGMGKLYALNPNGTVKWEYEIGGIFSGTINSPLVDTKGVIYIGAGSSEMTKDAKNGYRFVAIYPDGTEKWSFKTPKEIYSSAALSDDGTIIFGCVSGDVFALNPDGTLKWKFTKKDGMFDSTPAIGADGTVYISSTNKNLYAISADGKEKWSFQVDEFFETNPSIGQDGTIYFGILDKGVKDTHLYALNSNGTVKWKYKTDGGVYSTPAIDSQGIIYFGSYDEHVYSLNPDGSLRWKFRLGGPIVLSPSIDREGTLYFGTWDRHLYAIDGIKRAIIDIKHNDTVKRVLKEPCGDNICDPGEDVDCRDDCGLQTVCGDNICDQQEVECQDDCKDTYSTNYYSKDNDDKSNSSTNDFFPLILGIGTLSLILIIVYIIRKRKTKRRR